MIADPKEITHYRATMDDIMADSYDIYRDLVFNHPHFYDYFFRRQPDSGGIESQHRFASSVYQTITEISGLRAIPWVFSWSQTGLCCQVGMELVPASNALLTRLPENLEQLQKMYESWPFFRSLL